MIVKTIAGITAFVMVLNLFLFAMRKISMTTFWVIILIGFGVVQYLKAHRTK